jgi:hypothetical protein
MGDAYNKYCDDMNFYSENYNRAVTLEEGAYWDWCRSKRYREWQRNLEIAEDLSNV